MKSVRLCAQYAYPTLKISADTSRRTCTKSIKVKENGKRYFRKTDMKVANRVLIQTIKNLIVEKVNVT